ncbi:exopolyphosphatase [Ideonella sp. A 288]|uniref:exopolyphosphatase n=1 Tax=Ideonella sp. A 288 TaxID=1962181 RepID=UPI000B4C1FB7|nr:exopolyphosphatase [Ideonella sp. A 288]
MNALAKPYRLLTRSDMDGLVCAVLLKEMGMLGDIVFHHPKDVQDGKVAVTDRDIITNLPYVPGCGMCFDHHASEAQRNQGVASPNYILQPDAKSAARVVYDHFGGKARFPRVSDAMMDAVDKADSAGFSRDDVLQPQGWELLSFLMDARTGLGRFRDFRVSNYQLMMMLIDCCRDMPIADILALPDVKERVELFFAQHELFRAQIRRVAQVHGNLVVLDLRAEETIYAGNRFVVYAMFPQCDISMHVMWGREKLNTVYTVGKSIFDRGNAVDVGTLMLEHGGGGHHAAGTCQGPNETAEAMKQVLIGEILQRSRAAPAGAVAA